MGNIGEGQEEYEFEPLTIPEFEPTEVPVPVEPEREPEKVPA